MNATKTETRTAAQLTAADMNRIGLKLDTSDAAKRSGTAAAGWYVSGTVGVGVWTRVVLGGEEIRVITFDGWCVDSEMTFSHATPARVVTAAVFSMVQGG